MISLMLGITHIIHCTRRIITYDEDHQAIPDRSPATARSGYPLPLFQQGDLPPRADFQRFRCHRQGPLRIPDRQIAILEDNADWKIKLIPDKEAGTLTIRDNGIGMTAAEVEANIGTIAQSGTKAFIKGLKEQNIQEHPELIGQFGVGFYASFMAADRVSLITRRAGEKTERGSLGIGRETAPTPSRLRARRTAAPTLSCT
jgi:hypothetical protein